MVAKGYTHAGYVATYLGRVLTPQENLAVVDLVEPVEAWIDGRARRAWLTGSVAGEVHYEPGPNLYLRSTPVASVTSVAARGGMADASDTTLTAGEDYEVRSLAGGHLYLPILDPAATKLLPGYGAYDRITVAYVPDTGLPADIRLAATMLVCHYLRPVSEGLMPGIKRYSVGGELTVEYADGSVAGVPDEVARLVAGKRRWGFV